MWVSKPHDHFRILAVAVTCGLVIYAYGLVLCMYKLSDPLTFSVFPPPVDSYLDGWGVSHFLFYFVLTLIFPARWLFIFVIGVMWELLEYTFMSMEFMKCKIRDIEIMKIEEHFKSEVVVDDDRGGSGLWWKGRWQDIVMNSLGITLALSIRYAAQKKI